MECNKIKGGGEMTLTNEYGDTIEVTDKIKVTLNTKELKYNYSYWSNLHLAKGWVRDFRQTKCTWDETN